MSSQPLTQKQLSEKLLWDNFPEVVGDRLFQHYLRFQHGGNLNRAKADVQRCSDTLFELVLGTPLDPLVQEHRRYFGQASSDDLAAIAEAFTQILLNETTEHQTSL